MLIAIACTTDFVAGNYGSADLFMLFEILNARILSREILRIAPGEDRSEGLSVRNVDLVLCARIGSNDAHALFENGLKLQGGVSGGIDLVLQHYLAGTLQCSAVFIEGE